MSIKYDLLNPLIIFTRCNCDDPPPVSPGVIRALGRVKTIQLQGQEIELTCHKVTKINCYSFPQSPLKFKTIDRSAPIVLATLLIYQSDKNINTEARHTASVREKDNPLNF